MATLAAGAFDRRECASTGALARINLCYLWGHGRLPDLRNGRRFTEKVQLRKLFDRDPRQTVLMDKLAAKMLSAEQLGQEWITPTVWSGPTLPDRSATMWPVIVKARHGCNQYRVVSNALSAGQWSDLDRTTRRWIAKPYGLWLDEWAYRDTPRGLLAERLIGDGVTLPLDYKVYVFGGQATHVQVHFDRAGGHRWFLHDRDFRPLVPGPAIAAPRSLQAMLSAAEELARGFDFLRVDFYEVEGKPRFGEFCLYPGSGLDPFAADWIDFELGELWRYAQSGAVSFDGTATAIASAVKS